jgi:hypothetical protein
MAEAQSPSRSGSNLIPKLVLGHLGLALLSHLFFNRNDLGSLGYLPLVILDAPVFFVGHAWFGVLDEGTTRFGTAFLAWIYSAGSVQWGLIAWAIQIRASRGVPSPAKSVFQFHFDIPMKHLRRLTVGAIIAAPFCSGIAAVLFGYHEPWGGSGDPSTVFVSYSVPFPATPGFFHLIAFPFTFGITFAMQIERMRGLLVFLFAVGTMTFLPIQYEANEYVFLIGTVDTVLAWMVITTSVLLAKRTSPTAGADSTEIPPDDC